MSDTINRQDAIDALIPIVKSASLRNRNVYSVAKKCMSAIEQLPSAESLTDAEQRIFLAAMEREEKVCKEIDGNLVREAYEDSLFSICREIKRKVKGALWT